MKRLPLVCLLMAGPWALPVAAHEPESVHCTTDDGVEIVGEFHPARRVPAPVVILLHMYRSDHSAWEPLIQALHEAGVATLAIDLRGHGGSVNPPSMSLSQRVLDRDEDLFRNMHRDVFAAYEWLTTRPSVDLSRLGIVGASVGCSVAIDYAARDRSVDVVVCLTPGENYLGLDSTKHVAEFAKYGDRPMLLLATEAERKACDVLARIDESATVRIAGPGKTHGTHMFGRIDGIENQIVEFLTEHLGSHVDDPVVAPVDDEEYFAIGSLMDASLSASKRRLFSSIKEAEARGLKPAQGLEAMRLDDRLDSPTKSEWPRLPDETQLERDTPKSDSDDEER